MSTPGYLASEGGLLEGLSDDSDSEMEMASARRATLVKKEVCVYMYVCMYEVASSNCARVP